MKTGASILIHDLITSKLSAKVDSGSAPHRSWVGRGRQLPLLMPVLCPPFSSCRTSTMGSWERRMWLRHSLDWGGQAVARSRFTSTWIYRWVWQDHCRLVTWADDIHVVVAELGPHVCQRWAMRDVLVNGRPAIQLSAPLILLVLSSSAPSFILSSLYYSNQCFLRELESGCVKPIKNSVRIFALIGQSWAKLYLNPREPSIIDFSLKYVKK